MRRTSEYFSLEYIVQCKLTGQSWYQTIAAFNCIEAAQDYKALCNANSVKAGLNFKYQILRRGPRDRFVEPHKVR